MATTERTMMPLAQVNGVWMKVLFLGFNLTKSENKHGREALIKITSA